MITPVTSGGTLRFVLRSWIFVGLLLALGTNWGLSTAAAQTEDYRSLTKRGAYKEALSSLDKQVEPFEPNVPFYWVRERAKLRAMTGDYDQAIKDYEELTEYLNNPSDSLQLAEFYKYRGRMEEYAEELDDVLRQLRADYLTITQEEYLLVAGRVSELKGEDPKRILSTTYKLVMENTPGYLKVWLAAGDLARRKGSYATAAGYYEKALELDDEDPDAIAGLADCFWSSRDERLDAVLEALEEINPNHFRGNAVRVERLLDGGKIGPALERIEHMLEINPVHLEFLGLKAAAHFLNDDDAAVAETQKKALAFNPHTSDVYRIPGRVASRHYRFAQGAAFHRKALEVNPEDDEARAQLGFDLLRMGKDAEGKKELDIAFEADPYNVQVYNMLEVLDTMAEFETIKEGDFEIDLPASQAEVLGTAALDLLTKTGDALEEKYEVDLEVPVRVQIFDRHDDFIVRSVGLPGSTGHLGICFGQLLTMDSPTARPKGTMDWHSVLYHEFVHVITLQKTKNRMPRWLSEGISVHEETKRNPAWGMRLNPDHSEIISKDNMPKTSELTLYFTQPETQGHLMLGYYIAGAFVDHYTETYGEAALVDALARIAEKERCQEALVAAAGVDEEELDEAWHEFLKVRLEPFDHFEDMTAAMREGTEAYRAEDYEAAEAAFKRAHEAYPEYTGGNGPLAALQALYRKTENVAAETEISEKLLGLDSANLDGWKHLAALQEQQENWRGVADAGLAAVAVDPFDAEIADKLLEAAIKIEDKELALKTAGRLAHIDPVNRVDHKMRQVELLMALDRWKEAKTEVIRLLEEKPGFWRAQEILLELVEREKT